MDIEITAWFWSFVNQDLSNLYSISSKQPTRSQGIFRATNERTEKFHKSKIKRLNRFCVIFKSAHCGYLDQVIGIIGIQHKNSKLMPLTETVQERKYNAYLPFDALLIPFILEFGITLTPSDFTKTTTKWKKKKILFFCK